MRVLLRVIVLIVAVLLVGVFPCSQATVATISSFCGLQTAIQDASIVHIVVMEHLFFDPGIRCARTKAHEQNSLTDSPDESSAAHSSGASCDPERQRRDRDIEGDSGAIAGCDDDAVEPVLLPLTVQGTRKTIRVRP